MNILRREHVEDLHLLAGITRESDRAREAIEEPPMRRVRHRLPWLVVGLGGSMIATFGDMLHVPGSDGSLAECRANGGTLEVCYSPRAALALAQAEPGREVVFLGIGFETTIAPVVSLIGRRCASLAGARAVALE
jgi:hypothetical protein